MIEKGHAIDVLDKGYVRYVDNFGTDLRIVESARISYKSPSKGEEADKKLLHYLYKNLHTSPLEQCNITYNIKMPIFVMRQFVRHRMFRLNEQSGRYTEFSDDFYFPKGWRPQDTKNKQGSIETDNWNPIVGSADKHSYGDCLIDITASQMFEDECHKCYTVYNKLIDSGIAKEMARMILPVNIYTEIYVNCDLNNLLKFFRLRLDAHAQWEMREYAKAMYDIFKELYPWTAEAYEEYSFELVKK